VIDERTWRRLSSFAAGVFAYAFTFTLIHAVLTAPLWFITNPFLDQRQMNAFMLTWWTLGYALVWGPQLLLATAHSYLTARRTP
jgi:hypothetical protein